MKLSKTLKLLIVVSAVILSGCVSVAKIDSGERMVGDRMQINLTGAWNHINAPNITGPNCQTWTMEGLPIDQMLIYTGLTNDQPIHAESAGAQPEKKSFRFKSEMQPDQIVALFEGMLTRDGSIFKLTKLEPSNFGGGKGFHFEYSLIRKADNVELSGMGSGAVNKGQLYAIVYQAPKLVFYQRHHANVAHIMETARIKI